MVFELRITVSNISITILLLIGVMILFCSIKTEKKKLLLPKSQDFFFSQDFVEKKESALAIRCIQVTAMKDLGSNGPHENWKTRVISFFVFLLRIYSNHNYNFFWFYHKIYALTHKPVPSHQELFEEIMNCFQILARISLNIVHFIYSIFNALNEGQ